MSTEIKLSKVRLSHLNYYLSKDPRFAEVLAVNGIKHFEKGDEKTPFPVTIWELAEKIAKNGVDPCTLKSKQVIQWADFLLLNGPAPSAHARADVTVSSHSGAVVPVAEGPLPQNAPKGTGLEELPVRLAIATLCYAALEMARHDKHANADKDRAALEQVCQSYHPINQPQTGQVNA